MSFEQTQIAAGSTAKPQFVKLKQAELQALFTSHVIRNAGRGTFIPTPRADGSTPQAQAKLAESMYNAQARPVVTAPAAKPKKTGKRTRRKSTPRTTSGEEVVKFFPSSQCPVVDPYKWRKYGQKNVRASNYPRHYYKCSVEGCGAKKMVEKGADGERHIWKGTHSHPPQISKQITVTTQESLKAHVKNMLSEATNKLEVYCSTDVDPGEDGYYWRKYGQKELKVSRIPRSYFKCRIDDRLIRKQVEPLLATGGWKITYNSNSDTPRQRSNTTQTHTNIMPMPGTPMNGMPMQHNMNMPAQTLMSNTMAHISNLPAAHIPGAPASDINNAPPVLPYMSAAPTIPDNLPMSGAPTIGDLAAPTIGDIDDTRPAKKRKMK